MYWGQYHAEKRDKLLSEARSCHDSGQAYRLYKEALKHTGRHNPNLKSKLKGLVRRHKPPKRKRIAAKPQSAVQPALIQHGHPAAPTKTQPDEMP